MLLEDIPTSRLEKWHEVPRWLSETRQDNRMSPSMDGEYHTSLLVHAPKMGKGLSLLLSMLVLGCLGNNPIMSVWREFTPSLTRGWKSSVFTVQEASWA
jgi:hypothetical protein